MSDNLTFPFIGSILSKEQLLLLSLCRLGCGVLICGVERQGCFIKYKEGLAEQHLLSYCCIISNWREKHSLPETSPLVLVQTVYSVVFSTCTMA